jgi:hypothetical protein
VSPLLSFLVGLLVGSLGILAFSLARGTANSGTIGTAVLFGGTLLAAYVLGVR